MKYTHAELNDDLRSVYFIAAVACRLCSGRYAAPALARAAIRHATLWSHPPSWPSAHA